MSNLVFIIAFNLFGLLIILFIIFTSTLKKGNPKMYKDLGNPSLFGITNNPKRLNEFFKNKEYKSLENNFIRQISASILIVLGLWLATMLIMFVEILVQ
tara:strand:- start:4831 stop:5127 length:297 start_codon:yes stop_codon:yes gene_type:complete